MSIFSNTPILKQNSNQRYIEENSAEYSFDNKFKAYRIVFW